MILGKFNVMPDSHFDSSISQYFLYMVVGFASVLGKGWLEGRVVATVRAGDDSKRVQQWLQP